MGKFITLREEFESETGAHPFADQQYIQWLEKLVEHLKVVKNCYTPDIVRQSEQLSCSTCKWLKREDNYCDTCFKFCKYEKAT